MRNAHSIQNHEVGLALPPTASDDLLVPTLHNLLGNLTDTDFTNVIEALLETRADQRFDGRNWVAFYFPTDDGNVTFNVERTDNTSIFD